MRRALGVVAVILLGVSSFAAAAYTIMTAIVAFAFTPLLAPLVAVVGVLVTIGLVTLTKRAVARTFGT
jgi:hypothetical protein